MNGCIGCSSNLASDDIIAAKKWVCQTLSPANSFILANTFFGVGMPRGCTGTFLAEEGGIQMLAGVTHLAKQYDPN